MLTDPVELLQKLVSLPSVNPMGGKYDPAVSFESRVSDFLLEWSRELGIQPIIRTVAAERTNVILYWKNPHRPQADVLLLDAHQDTVPVEGMTIDPFSAEIKGGKLFGRGACDVKAGMAVMMSAFARLVTEAPPEACSLMLSCTVDEEATTLGINDLTSWINSENFAYQKPIAAVIAEPTDLDVIVTHRGVIRWKIITHGTACHSSTPELGENAIYRMSQVVTRLEAYAQSLPEQKPSHPKCGSATVSVGRIGGGTSVNIVPDTCWIEVDRRLIPGETAHQAREDIIAELHSLPFEIVHEEPWIQSSPLVDDNNDFLALQLLASIEEAVGKHEAVGVAFGTHASRTANIGIPSVVFGPGNIAQAHTKDEWVDLEQVRQAAEILYRFCKTFKKRD